MLRQTANWLQNGRRVNLATIVRTLGSAPRPVGAMLAVNDCGKFVGSVSGGCVEDDLINTLCAVEYQCPQRLTYGITVEQSRRHGLPCGGRLELLVETLSDVQLVQAIVAAIEARQVITRHLDLRSGNWTLIAEAPSGRVRCTASAVDFVYGPRWRLLIIGAGQLAHYLAQMALMRLSAAGAPRRLPLRSSPR